MKILMMSLTGMKMMKSLRRKEAMTLTFVHQDVIRLLKL